MSTSIEKFLSNNKDVRKKEETDHINFENLWNDTTFICRFEKIANFKLLENVELPTEHSGFFHKDTNTLELIYGPVSKNDRSVGRKFTFYFEGIEFEAFFDTPSDILKMIAIAFREAEPKSETDYRNLKFFREYFRPEQQPESLKKFFSDKVPLSFYIKGDFSKTGIDSVGLAKHLNFYMRYFDRKAPAILIFNSDKEKEKFILPCHSDQLAFPKTINAKKIDPVVLDLLHVINETPNIRLKYIFYYQVLEYCSYYHLNEELKRKLNNVVKNPDVLNNSSHYSRQIIDEFKNYFKSNDDRQKLEKLILDYCEYNDIKLEIKCNHKYFSHDLVFDGGFKIDALIKNEEDANNPQKDILKSIIDRIDKIRNVLVHIRESRENKVILPTKRNNHQLIPYLYLIRRIAEVIAFKYE